MPPAKKKNEKTKTAKNPGDEKVKATEEPKEEAPFEREEGKVVFSDRGEIREFSSPDTAVKRPPWIPTPTTPPVPTIVAPSVNPPTAGPTRVYTIEDRKSFENQETAAIIFSIMDEGDRRLLQFFARDFLRDLILCDGKLDIARLAAYLGDQHHVIQNRVSKLYDIGALFDNGEEPPTVNQKISQFVADSAPTY